MEANAELLLNGLLDHFGAAPAQHARRRATQLNVKLANWDTLVHRVEGGDLVDANGGDYKVIKDVRSGLASFTLKRIGNVIHH